MNTDETKILLDDLIKKLHSSNQIIAEELEKIRRLENALNLLSYQNFYISKQEQ